MTDNNVLLNLRNQVNLLDDKLLILLVKRRELVAGIAKEKFFMNRPLRDIDRENALLERLIKLGQKYYLDMHYVSRLFQIIIEDSFFFQLKTVQKYLN